MEENEQVLDTAIQENPIEQSEVQENKKSEYIAPSESEFKKAIQSASSKAKYDILKELGVKNIEEFKSTYNQYQDAIKSKEELDNTVKQYKDKVSTLEKELVITVAGVNEEYKEDLISLANSKISDTVDFKTAVDIILNKNPNWRKTNDKIKLGTEKSESKTSEISESLITRYPWLK